MKDSVNTSNLFFVEAYKPKSKKESGFKYSRVVFLPTSFLLGYLLGDVALFMVYYVSQICFWECFLHAPAYMEGLKRRKAITLAMVRRDEVRVHRRQVKELNQKIRKAKEEVRLASKQSLSSADAKEPSSSIRVSKKRVKSPKNLGKPLAF